MGTLRKEVVVVATWWKLKFHLFKASGCFQLTHKALKFGKATWKNLIGRFPRRAWRYIWCLTWKCSLWQPIIFYWPNLENFPYKHTLLSSLRVFNNVLPIYPPLGLSIKQPHFLDNLPNKDLTLGINWQPCGRHHGVYLIRKPMTTQPHHKNHIRAKEWNFVHLSRKKLYYFHLDLNTDVDCTWSNHWDHHNSRSLLPTTSQIIDLPLKIGRRSTLPTSRDNRLCHFCSYNKVENEVDFVSECPLFNPVRDHFSSLFENVVLGSLKSFFQLDQQVDISLYLMKATAFCTSRIIDLKPTRCTFNPISLLASSTLKSRYITF